MQKDTNIEEQFEQSLRTRLHEFGARVDTPNDLKETVLAQMHSQASEATQGATKTKIVSLFQEYTFASVASIIIVASVAVVSAIDFFGTQSRVAEREVLSAWVAQNPFATNTLEAGTLNNLASYFDKETLDISATTYDEVLSFFEQHGIQSTDIPRLQGVSVVGGKLSHVGEHTVAHLVLKTQDGHVLYMCSLPRTMVKENGTELSPRMRESVERLGFGVQCNGDTSAAIAIWQNGQRVHSLASCISVMSIQEYIPR